MIYSIRLTITHLYNQPAANSRHLIRVLPKTIANRQHLTTHLLQVFPEPDARSETVDFFETTSMACAHTDFHAEMSIRLACHVEVFPPARWLDLSPDVEQLCREWQASCDLSARSPVHFLGPSPRLQPDPAITGFARDLFDPSQSTAANVIRLGQALHDLMTFDATATHVDTEAPEAFALRRGVCQDFSHIMILALQALGIPAAYVSGYLRTIPPPGQARLEGADATHAWVMLWCGPETGWIGLDPTNDLIVADDHIVTATGRDYADVSPLDGVLVGPGSQKLDVKVDVVPATS